MWQHLFAHAFSRTDPSDEILDVDHPDMDADDLEMNGQVEESDIEDELQEGLGEVQDEGQGSMETATVTRVEGTVPRILNDTVPQICCVLRDLPVRRATSSTARRTYATPTQKPTTSTRRRDALPPIEEAVSIAPPSHDCPLPHVFWLIRI